MNPFPTTVRIVEVGPRDGLQSISSKIPTDAKIKYINLLSEAMLPEIEVTSFVSPKWIPQLSDAMDVSAGIIKHKNIRYTALVPNIAGLTNALESGYDSVAVFIAASETFSQKNTNCSIPDSLERMKIMQPKWAEHFIHVRGYISTVWECPYEGKTHAEKVLPIIDSLFELGVREISLGDTLGKTHPGNVKSLLDAILKRWPVNQFALHFHDTYNLALKNVEVGLEYGISTFDSSAGGVGGCPYAPGSAGNIRTENILDLCNKFNIQTGINKNNLIKAASHIQQYID